MSKVQKKKITQGTKTSIKCVGKQPYIRQEIKKMVSVNHQEIHKVLFEQSKITTFIIPLPLAF